MSALGRIASEGVSLPWLDGRQRSVLKHIADCHTARSGGNLLSCECGHSEIHYNSCRDRHCPLCQGAARARWVEARLSELLPCPYFHVVFTVPHELLSLALGNRRTFYATLFACVQETLLAVCGNPENLGGRVGGMSVLHTWNQKLGFHPHIHCIIPGGGISPDGTRWIAGNPSYLVSVKRLSRVFRGKLLGALEGCRDKTLLTGDDSAIRIALKKAAGKEFVVYAKSPFGSPAQVVKYLGRYTHRVGISEQRIQSFEHGLVRFTWIDRAVGHTRKTMILPHEAFVRKFLLHVLPKGFRKIRYFGYMGNRDRTESIARVRELIERSGCAVPLGATTNSEEHPVETMPLSMPEHVCPSCGRTMAFERSFDGAASPGWFKERLEQTRGSPGPISSKDSAA